MPKSRRAPPVGSRSTYPELRLDRRGRLVDSECVIQPHRSRNGLPYGHGPPFASLDFE